MRVTVHYMAQIRRSAGCIEEEVHADAPMTLHEFLRLLGDRRNGDFRGLLLDETGSPRRSLLFFVGDTHADLSQTLQDGDAVTILAPMAGG
jgi:molybdopterin converting factor small subunit